MEKIASLRFIEMEKNNKKYPIKEMVSRLTYHFTSLISCLRIMERKRFHLTMSTNYSDGFDTKRLFYLSTQRSKFAGIGYSHSFANGWNFARIEIDGEAINNLYKASPLNYWGDEMGKGSYYKEKNDAIFGKGLTKSRQTHSRFEMEDRIFSKTPVIEHAPKFIKRIDLCLTKENNKDKEIAMLICVLGKRNSVPVYVYNNLRDFNGMTSNTINKEMEDLYNSGFHAKHDEDDYEDSELYRLSNKVKKENEFKAIIEKLLNILTHGKIYTTKENIYPFISSILKKFGLEKFVSVIAQNIKKNHYTHNSYNEDAAVLGTSTFNLRRLAHEYYDDDDSVSIMKFAAYVLKKCNCSSFDQLAYSGQK